MKTIILALIASGLCAQAQLQPHTLSTTDGDTYTGITSQRIEPDGLYIEYSIPGGGIGMSKIKFDRLSRAQQKQYSYDPQTAREYEIEVAQANENCSQELIHRDQVARAARLQRDRENEQAYPGRMLEITRINASQAALAQTWGNNITKEASQDNGLRYSSEFGAGRSSTQTSFAPSAADIFPNRNIVVTRPH